MSRTKNPQGSTWNRWDPHLHTPGTILNNQFGKTTFEEFCTTVNNCVPPIRALGVTDYLSVENYEEVVTRRNAGHLPGVDLVFPNVEGRLDVGTHQGQAVNIHLLFSPDDPSHIIEIKRFLNQITYRHGDDTFHCSSEDLIRLGRAVDPEATDERRLKEIGTNQFKINKDILSDALAHNSWAQKNVLIAVAASSKDGTSGMRAPNKSFDSLRTSIESAADIIFSGNPNDRSFWCGLLQGASARDVSAKYSGLKPCLHGSDSHSLEKVGKPDQDRFTWIKGDVTFETLRQACIEPEERAYVGSKPPMGGPPGQTMTSVAVTNAPWMVPNEVQLNPGLIAIIGARGSGKTALADVLAVGAYAMSAHANDRSFVNRAKYFLGSSTASVKWASASETHGSLANFSEDEWFEDPRVQYLSQQFVEDLCSAEGVTDRLLEEIQRVIFISHSESEREGANNFDGLYGIKCNTIIETRNRHEQELLRLTERFVIQSKLNQSIGELSKRIQEYDKSIAQLGKDRAQLVSKDQQDRAGRHTIVQAAMQRRKFAWESEKKRVRSLNALKTDLDQFRVTEAPAFVDRLRESRGDSGLTRQDWEIFTPVISDTADTMIQAKILEAEKAVASIYGVVVTPRSDEELSESFISQDAPLDDLPVTVLQAESDRLARLVGLDKQKAVQFQALSKRIEQNQKELEEAKKKLVSAEKAEEELKLIRAKRRETYRNVFATFVELQRELEALYAPLEEALQAEAGALGKLKFVVRRLVDLDTWVKRGEDLFDLRKDGPFKGKGSLRDVANQLLVTAWESGDPSMADKAIDDFIDQYREAVKKHRLDSMDGNEWIAKIWEWLLSTDHISVKYGIQYSNVDIERLSPGTRGIVLLLLYLAIDKEDMRPLIIDQPEENLDPQSIHDELVKRFRDARTRRQIIIVTHNANLVVNTDADQVIIASAGEHQPGHLPEIKYHSGGLESDYVRAQVCEILEGGEEAFRARARRLRLLLD